jgi:hypothetical protein
MTQDTPSFRSARKNDVHPGHVTTTLAARLGVVVRRRREKVHDDAPKVISAEHALRRENRLIRDARELECLLRVPADARPYLVPTPGSSSPLPRLCTAHGRRAAAPRCAGSCPWTCSRCSADEGSDRAYFPMRVWPVM